MLLLIHTAEELSLLPRPVPRTTRAQGPKSCASGRLATSEGVGCLLRYVSTSYCFREAQDTQ